MSALIEIKDIWIEGRSDEVWNPIINGASLSLKKGEVVTKENIDICSKDCGCE